MVFSSRIFGWLPSSIAMMLALGFVLQLSNTASAEETKHLLQYKLKAGQKLRYNVVHMAKTNVRIGQTDDISQVLTASTKAWEVTSSDGETITFNHGIEKVHMTQQSGDGSEVRWDSESDEIPPTRFASVAPKLGQVLGTVTINSYGKILERSSKDSESVKLGMGEITLQLPEKPIAIGEQWTVPRELRITSEKTGPKLVKIRELYTLEKVQTGIATIKVKSEPLTPISEQSERAQLLQQLSNGTIRFDIDAGHVISRRLDWDTSVVGFQGPQSNMEYLARLTEDLAEANAKSVALRPQTSNVK